MKVISCQVYSDDKLLGIVRNLVCCGYRHGPKQLFRIYIGIISSIFLNKNFEIIVKFLMKKKFQKEISKITNGNFSSFDVIKINVLKSV